MGSKVFFLKKKFGGGRRRVLTHANILLFFKPEKVALGWGYFFILMWSL